MRTFGSGFLLSLSVCLDLGLVNVAILRTALRHGARPAFWVGLGSCFGDLTYFALSAVGVTALLAWPPARWALWLGGTAVLLVLTARALRDAIRPRPFPLGEPEAATQGGRAAGRDLRFRRLFPLGLALALASPTAILWFAAVGGEIIASSVGAGQRRALVPFVAGFFAAGVVWSLALALAAAALGRVGGRRVVRALSAASAVLFAYFAVVVFRDGWRALLS
ncbi:MAG TPA: LysE family transporter [Polyangia bacterium]|nr:LysE family transporter [Polyangia bacterium]